MSEQGLAEAQRTTPAPKMYQEIEQGDEVARGHVKVTEVIAYDATKKVRRLLPEKHGMIGEPMTDAGGKTMYVEVARKPFFCQDSEDVRFLKEKNPTARIETFGIQMLKSAAIKYIEDPYNLRAFGRKVSNG